jgi:hypothetical protein
MGTMMDKVHEAVGRIEAKADAAHKRLDRVETEIKEDLKEIKKDLREFNSHMNKGKGWAAAGLLIVGLFSSAVGGIVTYFLGAK